MTFRLPTSQEKADYVRDQFERIAKRYDLTNDVISLGMHRMWKQAAVSELINSKQGSYLDVCCGTGDLALTIARRLGTGGKVTGLDFSRNMLSVANDRAVRAQSQKDSAQSMMPMLAWVEGDAQKLPFADNSFDGAIVSFGLRNLTNLQQGLNEMARVVRPGGKVLNLDLGHSTVPLFSQVFRLYFRYAVPLIGDFLQGDRQAYTYLPESLNTYPTADKITEMFEQAGLTNVRHVPLALGSVSMHVGVKP